MDNLDCTKRFVFTFALWSEETPSCTLLRIVCLVDARYAEVSMARCTVVVCQGVINFVMGDAVEIGNAMMESTEVHSPFLSLFLPIYPEICYCCCYRN